MHRILTVSLAGILLTGLLAACGASASQPAASAAANEVATTAPATAANTTAPETNATSETDTAGVASVPKLNLNTATADEFLTIPNVGNRMVREFFEYRPYVSIQQFRREIGKYVDAAQVAAYEQYVYVPVNPNEADAATLQQLPGVDATVAAELVAARPYADNAAFLARLAEYLSADKVNSAAAYLEGK